MTVTEVLGSLGSWTLRLTEGTPDDILTKLGFFGHIAIVRGRVDVSLTGDSILSGARYVGVLRENDKATGRTLSGSGMIYWLGDEDHKGRVIESKLSFSAKSLTFCINAVLPPSVHVGTIHDPGGTYTGDHQYQTPRDALDIICAAFGVEYRVNGNGTIDVGTQAQLYATTPKTTIVRRGTGSDMDLTALGGAFDVDSRALDYSSRILLFGQTTDGGTIVNGSLSAATNPYRDLFGNPVTVTRMISESGQTVGSVASRLQLQLNRFNRTDSALKVTAENYEIEGTFAVGDNAFVFDPDTGLVDATQERYFNGERINPAVIRISALTWPVTDGHTVAFRAQDGTWYDLTRYVVWENGSADITVGDMPQTLTSSPNPVLDRTDAAPDTVAPNTPTALTLSTFSVVDSRGGNSAIIRAAWTAPTQSADGSTLADLAYYVVAHRVTGRPQWEVSYVDVPALDLPAVIDVTYDVKVAAVDKSNNASAYTAVSTIHTALDTIPPNPPSDPSVGNYIGQLRIVWDGKDNTGATMEAGAIVNVHVSATSGFTPDNSPGSATLVAQLSGPGAAFATAPYGSTRYVKLVAVDTSLNFSAPSGQVSGATAQATDGDVASINVGKLTAGTMSADVVIGGRFATALTGARVEVNSLGFQKFDVDGVTKLVSITGTEALLTGLYKSATTGRRIEIGAAGTSGEMDFYAPDGTKTYVRAFTEATGVESIQLGLPAVGSTSFLWNKMHMNTDEWAQLNAKNIDMCFSSAVAGSRFLVAHTATKRQPGTNGFVGRFQVDANNITYWDAGSVGRWQIQGSAAAYYFGTATDVFSKYDFATGEYDLSFGTNLGDLQFTSHAADGHTDPNASPRFLLFTGTGFGTQLLSYNQVGGSGLTTEHKVWDDSGWANMRGSAFTVVSDENTKTGIVDLDPVLAEFREKVRPRKYKRKRSKEVEKQAGPAREEVGLILQEVPDRIKGDGGIDAYQFASYLAAVVKELDIEIDTRLRRLEGE